MRIKFRFPQTQKSSRLASISACVKAWMDWPDSPSFVCVCDLEAASLFSSTMSAEFGQKANGENNARA